MQHGRRCRRGSEESAPDRGRGRGDGRAQEGGHDVQGPVPVPRGEDAELRRHACPRELEVLRLWARRRRLQLRHAARQRDASPRRSRASPPGPASSSTSGPPATTPARRRLRDVLETAIALYHVVLTSSKTGQPALDYLRERGFTDETIDRFQLGWAPGGWDTMSGTLATKRGIRPRRARRGRPDDAPRPAAGAVPTTASANGSSSRSATRTGERWGSVAATSSRPASRPRADARDHGPKYLNSPAHARSSTRAGRCTSSTGPRAPSARAARRSSSRATPTRSWPTRPASTTSSPRSGTALTPGQVALVTPVRQEDRPRLRRRSGRPERRHVRGHRAQRAHRRGPGGSGGSDAGIGLIDVGVVRLPEGKDPDEVIRE